MIDDLRDEPRLAAPPQNVTQGKRDAAPLEDDLGPVTGLKDDLGEIKASGMTDDLGDIVAGQRVGEFVGKALVGKSALETPAAKAWFDEQATAEGLTPEIRAKWEANPSFWTPEDTDNAITYGPPAAALAAGLMIPPLGAAGTLVTGMGLGAATRGTTAALRGEDVTGAMLDPSSVALDAALSGIPAVAAGTKYGFSKLPTSVQTPIRETVANIGGKVASVADSALTRIAQRYPRFGEKLIDASEGPMELANAYERPPIPEADLSTAAQKFVPGSESTGRSTLEGIKENTWKYAARNLVGSSDPLVDTAGRMVERAAKLDRTVEQLAAPRLKVLEGVAPNESEAVVNLLEQGIDVNAPKELAAKARPVRALLRDIDELRRGKGVYDEVTQTRGLELMDDGVPVQYAARGKYAPAQKTQFYYPQRAASEPDTGRVMTGIERIMSQDKLSADEAMKRLRGTMTGKTTGFTRGTEGFDYSKNLHDVLPRYVNSELQRVTNAAVFGGKPVEIVIETTRGPVSTTVGEKAATLYKHMLNTGQHEEARIFGNALVERYAPVSTYEGQLAREVARKTSDMALSHVALTQTGQMHTPIWASGGPRQIARGYAMVENNPDLKQLFAIGPQKTSFVDYLALGRGEALPQGGALPGPFEAMTGVENFLRGPNSYAAVSMIDDITQEAVQAAQSGKPFSAALVKRAAEAGTTPEHLAEEYLRRGTLERGTWLNSIQHLVDRWQYQTGPGEIGHWLRTPAGAITAQYRAYGIKASQHVLDDIIGPLTSSDPSLKALGKQRLKDFALYGTTSNAATGAIKALARGRAPSLVNMAQSGLTGPTGIVGDVGVAAVNQLSPEYGEHRLANMAEIPAASVPLTALEKLLGAGKDPGRALEGAATLAGAIDPRIPMYSAPLIGAARSLTR